METCFEQNLSYLDYCLCLVSADNFKRHSWFGFKKARKPRSYASLKL